MLVAVYCLPWKFVFCQLSSQKMKHCDTWGLNECILLKVGVTSIKPQPDNLATLEKQQQVVVDVVLGGTKYTVGIFGSCPLFIPSNSFLRQSAINIVKSQTCSQQGHFLEGYNSIQQNNSCNGPKGTKNIGSIWQLFLTSCLRYFYLQELR